MASYWWTIKIESLILTLFINKCKNNESTKSKSVKNWIFLTQPFIKFWPMNWGWENRCKNGSVKSVQKWFRKIFHKTKKTSERKASALFTRLESMWLFLFPRLKNHLKGCNFRTLQNSNSRNQPKAIPVSEFQHCYEEWKNHLRRCVASRGSLFCSPLKETMWICNFISIIKLE